MLRRQTEKEEKMQRQNVALLSLNTNNNDKNGNITVELLIIEIISHQF